MARFVVAAFVIISVIACTGGSDSTEGVAEGTPPEGAIEAPAEPAFKAKSGFFTAAWALWRAPTDEKKVPNPDGEGTVKNYLKNVERGLPLEEIGVEGEWSKVRIEDGTEAWIKSERILTGDNPRLATVVEESRIFKRPELLALVIESKLPAGEFLISGQTEGKFSLVDYPTGKYESKRMWVLTENLVFDETEIEAARVIKRVLALREKDPDGAAELEDLARGQFVGSKLLPLLDVVPEEPAPEAEIRPDGGAPAPTPSDL